MITKAHRKMQEIEHNIQVACVNWFKYQFPQYVIFAVPNGGKRQHRTVYRNGAPVTYSAVAQKLKDEGALAGVADLVIVANKRVIFIEMKAPKGKQQDTQKVFERSVTRLGHPYYLCHSLEEFMACVKNELYVKK